MRLAILAILTATSITYANPVITVDLPGGAAMDFVWIQPSSFTMGDGIDHPHHEVTISRGFYLARYEVTQGQWEAVLGTRPWAGLDNVEPNPNHPAVLAGWDQFHQLIDAINAAGPTAPFRLPTEAEWEYAGRAGTNTRWSFGDDISQLDQHAWHRGNTWDTGLTFAQPVGTRLPNPWGLHDMHGNAWEWVEDWYGDYPEEAQTDPQGPKSGERRAIRGGGFNTEAESTIASARLQGTPVIRLYYVGARLAMDGTAPTAVVNQGWAETKKR